MIPDLRRILALWRGRLLWLTAGLIVSLLSLALAVGLLTAAGAALASLALFSPALLRGLGAARVLLRYAERMVTHSAMFRALADVRVWLFQRLSANAAGGLGFRQAGDVLARLVNDVESLDGLYMRVLLPLAGAAVLLPVTLIVLAPGTPVLALAVGTLFGLAAFALPWWAMRGSRESGVRLSQAMGQLRVAVLDTMTGWREVRAFAAEGRMLAAAQAREATLLGAQHALAVRTALAGAGAFLCAQAALLAVLCAAAGGVSAHLVLALFLVLAAFEVIGGLPRAGAYLGLAGAAARRVLEAADAEVPVPDPASPAAPPPLSVAGSRLRFDSIHFRYRPDHPPVLDGLTLDLPPGTRAAVLGASGSGKSTLAALALKIVAPEAGQVFLGRVDIASLTAADVRARIGWLSQATHLFDDTIRNNLLIARPPTADPGGDDAALWAALDAARIGEVARALPDGLDTWVGESGARFSGGQGRRLALARALLSPAPVLILDEPCAGLDAETERAFLATLNEAAGERTVLLIAHRLIGVERLDRVYRLSGGKAVAAAG